MLRITPSENAGAAKQYFGKGLSRDDYYIGGQEIAGTWGGKAAERLGLAGQVDQHSYFALCDNRHPETNERLTPRQKEHRRVGYDFTFSAPKSVSVLYELSGDERILDAFRQSVKETMEEIETEMKTRVRAKGRDEDRLTGNMAWAEFVHFTARPVDGKPSPHLHAHCFAFNTTFDETEGRWKAGQFGDLKREAYYYEAAFDARLSHRLNAMGYATEKDRRYSFTLAQLPKSITDKFSERRNEIERKAAAKGVTDAEGKHAIGYYGREHKNAAIGKAELRREWDGRLSADERAALAEVIHGNTAGGRSVSAEEAMAWAIEDGFERESAVAEKRLRAAALRYGVGSVLPESVAGMSQFRDVIATARDGQLMTTTKAVLNEEIAMLTFARDGHGKCAPLGKAVDLLNAESLSVEQRKAALHVINSRDRVVGIRGGAGTGKTHALKAIVSAIETNGTHVFAFAPSAQASRGVLRAEGFNNAETLTRLLVDEAMQKQVRGQVLLIDEAGLASSRQMRDVFALARKQHCRVIAVGDYRQHGSIERGDAFRLLESESGVRFAEITEIRRQKDPAYKKAVAAMSKGTAAGARKGFDALDRMGAIVEAAGEVRHSLLVSDYLRTIEGGESALIVAPTHSEGEKLTDELRRALKEREMLGRERTFTVRRAVNWTEAERRDSRNYEAGMVIDFHQAVSGERRQVKGKRETLGGFTKGESAVVIGSDNGTVRLLRQNGAESVLPVEYADRFQVYRTRELEIAKGDRIRISRNGMAQVDGQTRGTRLNNGDVFTVEGFTREGDIRLGNGKLLPKGYGHFTFGYVDTSHASQGKTVDRVFISVGNESLGAANQPQWYVSASRAREAARVYVESKQDLRDAIVRTGERLSAVELTKTRLRPSWGERMYKSLMERSRVARFIQSRAEAWRYRKSHEKGGMSYA